MKKWLHKVKKKSCYGIKKTTILDLINIYCAYNMHNYVLWVIKHEMKNPSPED